MYQLIRCIEKFDNLDELIDRSWTNIGSSIEQTSDVIEYVETNIHLDNRWQVFVTELTEELDESGEVITYDEWRRNCK